MACAVAENSPLERLRVRIGAPPLCHSRRPGCMHGLASADEGKVLGSQGAAIGYCQALFRYSGSTASHTAQVLRQLREAGAPWAWSHELFWGFKQPQEQTRCFVSEGMRPLSNSGRVPVVISGLDPAVDEEEVGKIVGTDVPVADGATVLLRVVLRSEASIEPFCRLHAVLVERALRSGRIPQWWLLAQFLGGREGLGSLKAKLGSNVSYVNVAVNPFSDAAVYDHFPDEIVVAQTPIGDADNIHDDGTILIPSNMAIAGANDVRLWSLPTYVERVGGLGSSPTYIVLGPALPGWTDRINIDRVGRFAGLLRSSRLWPFLNEVAEARVMAMPA